MKLNSDVGDSGSKKCKGSYGGAYGGIWQSPETGAKFCVGAGIWLQRCFHIQFYKFCTCNAICKYNVAINHITVQHNICPSLLIINN